MSDYKDDIRHCPKPFIDDPRFPGVQESIKNGDMKKPANHRDILNDISEEALNTIPSKNEFSLE